MFKKKILTSLLLISIVVAFSLWSRVLSAQERDTLIGHIEQLQGVAKVEKLPSGEFNEKYLLYIEQPIDHKSPLKGDFNQRVILMNRSFDRPTVIVTEGYGASYALRESYREELSKLLDANLIVVEHRFFLESTPKEIDWRDLTAENAANDLHRVRELLGALYNQGSWIATGISKGGQTALLYRAFFPEDVEITIPYVAPLCKAKEDGRHEPFLKRVGSSKERERIEQFQRELLERRGELQPKFDSLCGANNYQFKLPLSHIYDFTVLEYPFSFWQWGSSIEQIPASGSSADKLFNYWVRMVPPSYFDHITETTPFFVQASHQLGYYGYDIKPFKGLLSIKSAKGYLDKIFIPEECTLKFDRKLYKKLKRFVAKGESKMLFIYGEYDPWSAVKVSEPKGDNIVLFVQPKGSHRARISTLPTEMREEAIELIKNWLKE